MGKIDYKTERSKDYISIAKEAEETFYKQSISLRKQFEQVAEAVKIPSEFFNYLSETLRSATTLYRSIAFQIRPLLQMQKQLSDQARQVTESIRKAIHKIDFQQLQVIARDLADEGVRLDVLIKTGWWYCPSMAGMAEEIKSAALKYKRGDKNAMSNLMKQIYHRNNYQLLQETVQSWQVNPLFNKRFKVIKNATSAHIRGEYTLSIPALLPLVEGIATEYCKSKGIDISRFRNKGQVKVEKAFEELAKSGEYPFKFPDLFLQIIADVIYQDTRRSRDPFRKKLNRHGVLHGAYIHYYDGPRSLRCFLMLDALSALK